MSEKMPKVIKLPEFTKEDSEEYWGKEDHPGGTSLKKASLRVKRGLKILSKGGGGTPEEMDKLIKEEDNDENRLIHMPDGQFYDKDELVTHEPKNKI